MPRREWSRRFWEWVGRPAQRLEHMRLEGFSESEVDGFVLRATLQKTALVLIAWGVVGLTIFAASELQRGVGMLLWAVYALATAVYVAASLFAVALHLLVVTRRWLELRHSADAVREFGQYPLKVAADAVTLVEVVGVVAFAVVMYQRLWPD